MDGEGCGAIFGMCLITLVAGMWIGAYFGNQAGQEKIKKEAIEHNAAAYVIVDPATGRTEFQWREN